MIFSSYTNFYKKVQAHGFATAVKQTAALGIDAVELIQSPHAEKAYIKSEAEALAHKRILEAYGLSVSCYSLACDLLHTEKETLLSDVFRNIEIAAALGSPYFHHTLVPDFLPQPALPLEDLLTGQCAQLGEIIAKRCNERGMLCLYEPQGMQINGVAPLAAWVAEMRARGCRVGVCGDLGNSLFVDTFPTEIFTALSDEIKQIHVKDYFYSDQPLEHAFRTRNGKYLAEAPVGKGAVDFARCFSRIADFDGTVSMENNATDEELQRSIAYIKSVWQEIKKS